MRLFLRNKFTEYFLIVFRHHPLHPFIKNNGIFFKAYTRFNRLFIAFYTLGDFLAPLFLRKDISACQSIHICEILSGISLNELVFFYGIKYLLKNSYMLLFLFS